jgi:Ca2+-binding EF-hand superfamily protein
MGSSFSCFRSRLPPLLTTKEINMLTLKTNLTIEDINQWYSRFVHCYPHGYLSEKQFINYYQQVHDEYSLQLKPLIKQLFKIFDLSNDQKLDFSEFILFHVLTNDGSIYEKIKLIFNLYNKEKDKYFSRYQIKEFLRNMFDLLDIPSSKLNIIQVIDFIYQKNKIKKDEKINWKQFTEDIMNDQYLYEQLISLDFNKNYQVIQRSERF